MSWRPLVVGLAVGVAGWLLGVWRNRRCRTLDEWPGSSARAKTPASLALAGAMLGVCAVLPGEPTAQSPGGAASTVFVIDVSRSMTATDDPPTRAAVGAQLVRQLLDGLPGAAALVVFGRDAVIVSPLTTDAQAIALAVTEIEETHFSAGAGSAPAPALAAALDMLSSAPAPRSVLIVSDGEWTDIASLDDVLTRAAEMRVRVSTFAVGTVAGDYLDAVASSERHLSRLDRDAMIGLAARTAGQFFDRRDGVDVASLVGPVSPAATSVATRWADLLRLPLLLAALLLVVIGAAGFHRAAAPGLGTAIAVALVGSLSIAGCRHITGPLEEGNRSLDAGDTAAAISWYAQVAPDLGGDDAGLAAFNLGVAFARAGEPARASGAFAQAAAVLARPNEHALALFNHGVVMAAVERLPEAALSFIAALRIDPTLEDARINLTIVRDRLQSSPPRAPLTSVAQPRFLMPRPRASSPPAGQQDW